MSKTLIIAEKPSVAADIAKVVAAPKKAETHFEGDSHVVSWAVGHLLELVEPDQYDEKFERWRLQDLPILPDEFRREPIRDTKKQLTALERLMARKDVARVVNACDSGREGELIFREIYRWAECGKPVDRLWLQSMTPTAIKASLAKPRQSSDVDGLADAADCRAESDWLIGMNATRALTVRLRSTRDRGTWSAGRVQTAALAMAVRREREILAHEPRAYCTIRGTFAVGGAKPHEYEGTWFDAEREQQQDRVMDAEQRDAILARVRGAKTALATETRKERRDHAPPLLDLTTLQREVNRRHGFSARRVLESAQRLYEARKLITYPRTDSRALPSDYRDHVQKILRSLASHESYGAHAKALVDGGLQNEKRNFDDSEVTDHFAIIPTGEGFPDDLPAGEREVFDLVVRRFLAAFHPPAVSTEIERITAMGPDRFRTRRSVLEVPGWKGVFEKEAADSETALPPLPQAGRDGTSVEPRGFEVDEKETRPPARLTEATLLKLMETAGKEVPDEALAQVLHDAGGIGTPATRAEIIETLLSREYLERITDLDGRKAMRATGRGLRLIDALERIGLPQLTSPASTAHLEDALRDMEHGKRERSEYMGEVKDWTREIVEKVRAFTFDTLYEGTESPGPCPACGAPVRESLRAWECSTRAAAVRRAADAAPKPKARRTRKAEAAPSAAVPEGCRFILWKEVWGRYLDRATVSQLLATRQTPPKAGFFTKQGREYQASLRLGEAHALEVVPRSRGEAAEGSAAADFAPLDIAPCPFHPQWIVKRTAQGYRCEGYARKECKLSLPLVLAQRPLQPEDVTALITGERKTPVLEGFVSKRGRPFKASLQLQDNARLLWEFPPRESTRGQAREAAPRKQFPVDPTPVTRCPRHRDADVVETPEAYACKEQGCKLKVPREVCQRVISRDEVKALLQDKRTPVLEGFVSKRGKPFNATLALNLRKPAGWQFEFDRG